MSDEALFPGEPCYDLLKQATRPRLSFNKDNDQAAWKHSLQQKFIELTGLDDIEKNKAPSLSLQIEGEEKGDGYKRIRFSFASEIDCRVPCDLLIPDTGKEKYPVAIALRGHLSDYHRKDGEHYALKDEAEQATISFGEEAVKNGYIALCIEQRGMGKCAPRTRYKNTPGCRYVGMVAVMLGRTIMGERIFDVCCAIDALSHFPQCDTKKILITGHSTGGGTAAYYAACYDTRIKLCVTSCSFCPYSESSLDLTHCACSIIPCAYQFFDMQDLAALIAPRPLAVVTGALDKLFPLGSVREGFETVKKIYEREGAPSSCRLIEMQEGHEWCANTVWSVINTEAEKLGLK